MRPLPALVVLVCVSCTQNGRIGEGGIDADLARLDKLVARRCLQLGACRTDSDLARIRGGIRAGRIALDAALVEACLAGSDTIVLDDLSLESASPCARLFVGRVKPGQECDTGLACQSGSFCRRSDYTRTRPDFVAGGCGVCTARRGDGGVCDGHGWEGASSECADGLLCTGRACRPRGAFGDVCATGADCRSELGLSCRNQLCSEPAKADGAACDGSNECASGFCDVSVCRAKGSPGDACAYPWQCVPGMTCDASKCRPAARGDACWESHDPVMPDCSSGDRCVTDATAAYPYHCRAVVELARGAACAADAGCPGDAFCQCAKGDLCRERCVHLVAPGDACSGDSLCIAGSECVDGTCALLPKLGEPCRTGCAQGRCVSGVCSTLQAGAVCTAAEDDCGGLMQCNLDTSRCETQPGAGESCGVPWPQCDLGSYCTDGRCAAVCILGE